MWKAFKKGFCAEEDWEVVGHVVRTIGLVLFMIASIVSSVAFIMTLFRH